MTADYDSSLLRTVHLVPLTAYDNTGQIAVRVTLQLRTKSPRD